MKVNLVKQRAYVITGHFQLNSIGLGMFIRRLLFAFINTKIINLLFFTCYEGKFSKTKEPM